MVFGVSPMSRLAKNEGGGRSHKYTRTLIALAEKSCFSQIMRRIFVLPNTEPRMLRKHATMTKSSPNTHNPQAKASKRACNNTTCVQEAVEDIETPNDSTRQPTHAAKWCDSISSEGLFFDARRC
jgi:hypothetical protein